MSEINFRMNELKQAQDLQQHDQAMRHGHDLKNIRINPLRKVFKSCFIVTCKLHAVYCYYSETSKATLMSSTKTRLTKPKPILVTTQVRYL